MEILFSYLSHQKELLNSTPTYETTEVNKTIFIFIYYKKLNLESAFKLWDFLFLKCFLLSGLSRISQSSLLVRMINLADKEI